MHIAVFGRRPYDKQFRATANRELNHAIACSKPCLTCEIAALTDIFRVIWLFANDQLDRRTLELLAQGRTHLMTLRCVDFDHADHVPAGDFDVTVVGLPACSPHAVAEHILGPILTSDRTIHCAYNRACESSFALKGLLGFDLYGQPVGMIGIGHTGSYGCTLG